MKRLADILLSLAALLLLAACTDDADVYNNPTASEGNLCVYVPVTREGDEVKSSLDPSNPTYNASVEECKINDLHLYAFPVGVNGTFLSQELPSPEASNMLDEKVASYRLKIKPGTYRVYVVANMKDVLDVNSITTEDDLKKVVLSYQPMSKPGMPVANNIPMIYEPDTKAADGSTVNGTITINNTETPKIVAANLRFTCVKVCLNLVYDPNATGVSSALKNGMIINDVKAERLSPSTNLLWDGMFSNSSVSDDYAKGFVSTLYDNASTATGNGLYYSDWTETPANANVNDQNIISVKSVGTAKPVNIKQKWLFRATYYLPERYVAKAAQQSALKIGCAVGGHNNSYNINLGHRKDESSTTEVPTFPRGTYYEIVGRIKSLGNIDLDCVVGVKEWKLAEVDADLTHTTLWVSKTSAEVTSLQNAIIDYTTNADSITFGCDDVVQKDGAGKLPIVVMSQHDPAKHRVTFSINPDLSIADFGDANVKLNGTAKVWIKANNLKKYLNVEYDVTPYFKVDPVDIVIFYDQNNPSELTKVVKFTTNLSGIQFPSDWSNNPKGGYDVSYAQSTINIKCENTHLTKGTFTITAKTDPQTTTTHTFTVKSIGAVKKDAAGKDIYMEQPVRVTVRPPKGNYIIYMRAINDLAWCNGGGTDEYMHSLMLDEDSGLGDENNNWRDGWWEAQEQDSNNNWQNVKSKWDKDLSPHPDYHFVYIYTQIGETNADGTKDDNNTEWYFTKQYDKTADKRHTVSHDTDTAKYVGKWWPGDMMTADKNNPGWYYYSISVSAQSVGVNKEGKAPKTIKPGQTLLVFSNGTYLDAGFQSHRFTHHNDPGITLFNYEDNEGWYLYDPLSDPYYRVFDEKPTVVDVEYTIYTKNKRITAWYCTFGVNSGDGKGKFTMWCNKSNVHNEFECEKDGKVINGNTWYKTILHLKAPLGEYAKILKLKVNGDEIHTELFGGENYPVTGKVTRTINGRNCVRYVIEGSFDPDTKTWSQGRPF
ncbi:fimbrial protein [uncultured Prevotella sp.]|uniref:fimbrial protein n=1 Tax=uncultured Prevotella sp. TaxID=159272 RepID=UPI0027E21AD9|nr:fimbrial protein [uncultured Prevotella sp.]